MLVALAVFCSRILMQTIAYELGDVVVGHPNVPRIPAVAVKSWSGHIKYRVFRFPLVGVLVDGRVIKQT